jgi:hypothetical protein
MAAANGEVTKSRVISDKVEVITSKEHIRGHLSHKYSNMVNQAIMVIV